MDSFVSPKDKIWFLRVCHHISNAVYPLCRMLGDHRAGLDGYGKPRPHRDSIPGPSSPQRAAIPSEISRPTEQSYSSTQSQPLLSKKVSVQHHAQVVPPPGRYPDTHGIGSWAGPTADLTFWRIEKTLAPAVTRTPDRLSCRPVAKTTTLFRLLPV